LFAIPEICLFYFKFVVAGVVSFLISADLVGEVSVTAVIRAGWRPNKKSIAKLKDDIAKHPRAKKLIVKPKIAVDMA